MPGLPEPRQYGGPDDLHRMRELVMAARGAREPRSSYWHVGDLTWCLYQNTTFDGRANILLWPDGDGGLRAIAWLDPPDELQLEVHPRETLDDGLFLEMLAWAEARCLAEGEAGALSLTVLEDDSARIALAERHGFTRSERHDVFFRRSLDDLSPAAPPDGIIIRAVADDAEFAERVAIHQEVWHPSKVTLEAYHRLRAAPGYLPALDLVAVTAEGRFASYCICWLDPANGVGEFEPMGTLEEFRRMGIGRAVVLEGLRRLREHGMHTAIVMTASFNAAALALYRSAGFAVVNRQRWHVKQLAKPR